MLHFLAQRSLRKFPHLYIDRFFRHFKQKRRPAGLFAIERTGDGRLRLAWFGYYRRAFARRFATPPQENASALLCPGKKTVRPPGAIKGRLDPKKGLCRTVRHRPQKAKSLSDSRANRNHLISPLEILSLSCLFSVPEFLTGSASITTPATTPPRPIRPPEQHSPGS